MERNGFGSHSTPHTPTPTLTHILYTRSCACFCELAATPQQQYSTFALPRGPETFLSTCLPGPCCLTASLEEDEQKKVCPSCAFGPKTSQASERWQYAVELGRVWEEDAVTGCDML
jgi:hypothetical protein